ncbi:hypothetical protein [Sphingomonas trueperi]|uniref:hypothetical protein n=1 Tax=Sphingomonas trueperi TaxID=53317 RepID=UPI000EB4DFDB
MAPTEEELANRIVRHLSWRNTEAVALIWPGYLAGLLEWSLIEVSTYDRLGKLLPEVGSKALVELFLDEPISPEQEAEMDADLAPSAQPESDG